jgi:peptidoglycan/LPS O-acetylase OafA/YrhL
VFGVRIFFVISGFVICRSLLAERRKSGTISLPSFYVRRAFRILPPLLVMIGAILAIGRLGFAPAADPALVRGVLFVCDLGVACGGYLGGHLWSLSVEEQFYLVFPAVLFLLRAHRLALAGLFPGLFLLAVGLYALHVRGAAVAGHFCFIAIGVAAAAYEQELRRLLGFSPSGVTPLALGAGLLLTYAPPSLLTTALGLSAMPICITLFVLQPAFRPVGVKQPLRWAPLVIVGQASYSIYLWQQLATYPFVGATLPIYCATILACAVGGLASYFLVERQLIGFAAGGR